MRYSNKLRVKPGKPAHLSRWDPAGTLGVADKAGAADRLAKNLTRMRELQYLLYAENRRSLLVVLQGIDAGGKDGTIRHVMTGLNPQGCVVTPFKEPTTEELDHDYLWRIHQAVPRRGEIGIFNRSHYEDVLVVRVKNLAPKKVWEQRYDQINAFEKILTENGVVLLKLFLWISKGEQKKRLLERLHDKTKLWKLTPSDFTERRNWNRYMAAYEDALTRCSTEWAPWYVIPADNKWFRNLAVSEILVETLEGLEMKFPKPSFDLDQLEIS